jgi:polyisoprenyl-teichoic acid--peptidoglycan teichoic acid transferase
MSNLNIGNDKDQNKSLSAPAILEDERPVAPKSSFINRPPLSKSTRMWIGIALAVILLFFTPWRINVLLLGVDPSHDATANSRSDTMILTSIPPVLPTVHMLSLPRDLYVDITGHGQNRINTAHFFAEVNEAGTGPKAAAETVALNFKVHEPYTVRIQIQGFKDVVTALGGVDVTLPEDMAGLKAGDHHLDADQALRFVRDRSGSDDYFRQWRAQIFLKGAARQLLKPINWVRFPAVTAAVMKSVDSNVPFFYYPRIAYTLLFSAIRGYDMQILDRYTMTTPWVTEGGGQVLLPNWDAINPVIEKYFK